MIAQDDDSENAHTEAEERKVRADMLAESMMGRLLMQEIWWQKLVLLLMQMLMFITNQRLMPQLQNIVKC